MMRVLYWLLDLVLSFVVSFVFGIVYSLISTEKATLGHVFDTTPVVFVIIQLLRWKMRAAPLAPVTVPPKRVVERHYHETSVSINTEAVALAVAAATTLWMEERQALIDRCKSAEAELAQQRVRQAVPQKHAEWTDHLNSVRRCRKHAKSVVYPMVKEWTVRRVTKKGGLGELFKAFPPRDKQDAETVANERACTLETALHVYDPTRQNVMLHGILWHVTCEHLHMLLEGCKLAI